MKWDYSHLDIDYDFDIPLSEYALRATRVRNIMKQRNIDLAFSFGTETFPGDVLYLSGFDINIEVASIVLLSQDRMYLLSGPEAGGAAQLDTRFGEPRMVWELAAPDLDYDRVPGVTTVKDCIDDMFAGAGPGTVGSLTYSELLSKKCHDVIVSAVPANADIVEATDILHDLRMNKSEAEQTLMRTSTAIAVEGMKALLNNGKPGMMECTWGAHAAFKMRELGAHSLAFQPMVQSGRRRAKRGRQILQQDYREGERSSPSPSVADTRAMRGIYAAPPLRAAGRATSSAAFWICAAKRRKRRATISSTTPPWRIWTGRLTTSS